MVDPKLLDGQVIAVKQAPVHEVKEFFAIFRIDPLSMLGIPWCTDTVSTLEKAEKKLEEAVRNDRRKHFIVKIPYPLDPL